MPKEIVVPAIKEGTVIDHIPSRDTFRIMRLLNPQEYQHTITIALNLHSNKIGKKGVIKISNRILTESEVNKVAILAPEATVSIIKNYEVQDKINVKLPEEVYNIVKCSNPNCVTNMQPVKTRFTLLEENPLKIRCWYCERSMGRDDIALN